MNSLELWPRLAVRRTYLLALPVLSAWAAVFAPVLPQDRSARVSMNVSVRGPQNRPVGSIRVEFENTRTGQKGFRVTDAAGNCDAYWGTPGVSYVMTPASDLHVFEPSSRTITLSNRPQELTFTVKQVLTKIQIRDGRAPIEGVRVDFENTETGAKGWRTTDRSGDVTYWGVPGTTYQVVPSSDTYSFQNPSRAVVFSLNEIVVTFQVKHRGGGTEGTIPGLIQKGYNQRRFICSGSRPSCIDPAQFAARCQYEQAYQLLTQDPPIWELKIHIRTGRGEEHGTDDSVYVQLTDREEDRVFLDRTQNDFQRGSGSWYHIVGGGVDRLSKIKQVQIGLRGNDGWCPSGVSLSANGSTNLFSYEFPGGCKWLDNNQSVTLPMQSLQVSEQARHEAIRLPNIIELRDQVEAALGNALGRIPHLGWNTSANPADILVVKGAEDKSHVKALLKWKGPVAIPWWALGGSETVTALLELSFDVAASGGRITVQDASLRHTYVSVSGVRGALAEVLGIDEGQIKKQLRRMDIAETFSNVNLPLSIGPARPTSVLFREGNIVLSWPDALSGLAALVNSQWMPGPIRCN